MFAGLLRMTTSFRFETGKAETFFISNKNLKVGAVDYYLLTTIYRLLSGGAVSLLASSFSLLASLHLTPTPLL